MNKLSAKTVTLILFVLVIGLSVLAIRSTSGKRKDFQGKDRVKKIIPQLESSIKKGMKDWNIPGMAVAIVKDDQTVYAKGFGVKKTGGEPVNPETLFQIGSTSKAFTAALVAMMVDEGKVKWKDKVIDHVPDFQLYDPWVTREIMVEELLEQHSGLPAYSGDSLSFFGFDRKYIKHALRFIKPVTSFRSEFAYVNHLFLVAAEIVEKKTGKSWEQNLKERIFKPLGMEASSADRETFLQSRNRSDGHHLTESQKLEPVSETLNWMYTYGPAGGINSNVLDMSKWLRMQIHDGAFNGKPVVSPENSFYVQAPKTIADSGKKRGNFAFYCASWVYEELRPIPAVWHNGETSGYHTLVMFWPEIKMGIVILTNQADQTFPEALSRIYHDLYFGNPKRDWSKEMMEARDKKIAEEKAAELKKPARVTPPMALEKYTGAYRNDVYGQILVEKGAQGLEITIGPDNVKMPLTHWDKDRFTPELNGETMPAGAAFETSAAGAVTHLKLEIINRDGCGVFEKVIERPAV